MGEANGYLPKLGEMLRGRREDLGLSQRQVSKRAKVSNAYIGAVERGENAPGIDVLVRWTGALGLTIDHLLSEAGLPTSVSITRDLNQIYGGLSYIERRALLRAGETLREVRAEYSDLLREEQAAYDRPELAEQERQDAEGWTRGEQP